MSTRNRTPPLLEPYLRLPSNGSQLLLTGVLDSTPQWLITRLLRSAFLPTTSPSSTESTESTEEKQNDIVVLVSWLRDYEFWKQEARRGGGVDLARLAQQDRFIFVDGLGELFDIKTEKEGVAATPIPAQRSLPVRSAPASPLPSRGGPLPARGPVPSRGPPIPAPLQAQVPVQPQAQPQQQQNQAQQQSSAITHLTSASISSTYQTLTKTLTSLQTAHPTSKIHLILDSPTLLLATSPNPSASALSSLLLSLRSLTTTCTLILQADTPFLSAALPDSPPPTPLETAHAAFVVQQAHVSKWVMSLRPLDTGKARDVSGVVRVSRGGAWDDDVEEDEEKEEQKELEALYFVQNDGGVRVFERGEASVG
jgi:elongator complex protein 6